MPSLANNEVISHLQALLCCAINLKEKFDKNLSNDAIEAYTEIYIQALEELKKHIPKEVINKGDLLRHSWWLQSNVSKHKPEDSYEDVKQICLNDVFLTEAYYLRYLEQAKDPNEKHYNWHFIHLTIGNLAKPRFENTQYADAVEAAFKEINDTIKQRYKSILGTELDGVALMREAFASTPRNNHNPLFRLADNSTHSGRNIQEGYMNLFVGAIQGIGNPKSHANLNIDPDEAWEKIVLASHLLKTWEKFN